MHILAILGSRNPQGRTAQATHALLQGASGEGSTTEAIFLTERNIERCRQCEDSGWGICRREGRCVIEDDFSGVVEKIKAADAVVFATPVYFSDLSESMRTFLDRLRRTCMHEAGGRGIGGKPAVGVCVAGGGGGGAPSCMVSLEKVIARCGFDVVDMIPVRRQNLEMKGDILEIVGRWLTTGPSSG
jgi:multimeric flavodoxin WrbA